MSDMDRLFLLFLQQYRDQGVSVRTALVLAENDTRIAQFHRVTRRLPDEDTDKQ